MKKFQLMTLLGLFVCVFTFVACGDDDDDETVTNPIVGTWVFEETDGDANFSRKEAIQYTFKNDGKFTCEITSEESQGDQTWGHSMCEEGTYTFSATDNVLKLTVTARKMKHTDSDWENEPMEEPYTDSYKVVFNGKKATLYWMSEEGRVSDNGTEFTKK